MNMNFMRFIILSYIAMPILMITSCGSSVDSKDNQPEPVAISLGK